MTEPELLTLTPENLPHEHLCCIIRTKKPHPGVEILVLFPFIRFCVENDRQ